VNGRNRRDLAGGFGFREGRLATLPGGSPWRLRMPRMPARVAIKAIETGPLGSTHNRPLVASSSDDGACPPLETFRPRAAGRAALPEADDQVRYELAVMTCALQGIADKARRRREIECCQLCRDRI